MTATRLRPVSRKPFTAELQQRRELRVSNEQILQEIRFLEGRLENLAVGNLEIEGASPGTLLDQVERTKKEIATLITQNTKDDRLATAARELQAVVRATEGATFTIIDIAERVDELLHDLRSHTGDATVVATADEIAQTTVDLYEACNFQDITGQRITKIVKALKHIEEKVDALIAAFGEQVNDSTRERNKVAGKKENEELSEDEKLMHGPQLIEKAQSQKEIDALLFGDD